MLRGVSDSVLPEEKKTIFTLTFPLFLERLRRTSLIVAHTSIQGALSRYSLGKRLWSLREATPESLHLNCVVQRFRRECWTEFSPPESDRSQQAKSSHLWMTLWSMPLMLANRNQTEVRQSSRWLGTNSRTLLAQMVLVIKWNTGYQSVSLLSICMHNIEGETQPVYFLSHHNLQCNCQVEECKKIENTGVFSLFNSTKNQMWEK